MLGEEVPAGPRTQRWDWLSCLGGAAAAAVVASLFFPELAATALWREKAALQLAGNLAVALLAVAAGQAAARFGLLRWNASAWFGAGFLLGVLPTAWARVGPGGGPSAGLMVGLALVAMGLGYAIGKPVSCPRRLGPASGVAGVALFLITAGMCLASPRGETEPPELAPSAADSVAEGPDVILISVDTLRADALARPETPTVNLNRLRAEAAIDAELADAPSGETRPSHVTMLTGFPIFAHGVWTNRSVIPEDLPLVAERFAENGWRTAAVVSNGVLWSPSGIDRGFQTYDDSGVRYGGLLMAIRRNASAVSWAGWLLDRRTLDGLLARYLLGVPQAEGGSSALGERTTRAALAYLDELTAGEGPYFLFLHYMDPHKPYWPDESVRGSLVAADDLPARYRTKVPWSPDVDAVEADLQADPENAEARMAAEWLHRVYDEETVFIDRCIGRVLDRVAAAGRPTVILFTADHGESFGQHGLFQHGNSVYGELLEVPFVLRVPDADARELKVRPRLEDVPRTLLGAAGLDSHKFGGRDLLDAPAQAPATPMVAGRPVGPAEKAAPGWQDREGWQIAVTDGGWKLILFVEEIGAADPVLVPRELYDLANDPDEANNLVDAEPAQRDRLLELVRTPLEKANPGSEEELTPEMKALLEELGYTGG